MPVLDVFDMFLRTENVPILNCRQRRYGGGVETELADCTYNFKNLLKCSTWPSS